MDIRLVVLSPGKHHGLVVPVTTLPFEIGRSPACQLRAASMTISNRHCVLGMRGDQPFVRDLNSTNGTLLNGELLVGEVPLSHGDELQVGPLRFEVRIADRVPVDQSTPLPANKAVQTNAGEVVKAQTLPAHRSYSAGQPQR